MKKFVALLTALLLLVNLSVASGSQKAKRVGKPKLTPSLPGPRAVPGQIVVKYKTGTQGRTAAKLEKSVGVLASRVEKHSAGVRVLTLANSADVTAAVERLEHDPRVDYAEPNYIVRAAYRPSDPRFGYQWPLENTGRNSYYGTSDADIDATDAWNFERGLTNPVTIAVLDTGIDKTHPDLQGKLWTNAAETAGVDGVDDDRNGFVDDKNGAGFVSLGQLAMPNSVEYLGSAAPDPHYSELAQSFDVSLETTVSGAQVALYRYGTPTDGVRVSIRQDDPAGPDLAFFDVAPEEVTSTPSEFFGQYFENITLVDKPLNVPVGLSPGRTYYLVLHTDANSYDDSYAVFYTDRKLNAKVDPFPGGSMLRYDTTWTADAGADLYFGTDAAGADVVDEFGHGTHVSGIAGASANNGQGIAGVSFGAKIMPVKVLDRNGMGTVVGLARGIRYAADNGARVINMSLGYDQYSETVQNAIDYAVSKGAVLVAAAGNYGEDFYSIYDYGAPSSPLSYPAANNNVIGVGATDPEDNVSYFSSRNSSVDIAAPGEYVYSTTPTYPVTLSFWGVKTGYDFFDGTSMAAPHVSGVAALMLSANPSLTPAQVETYLRLSAEDMGEPGRDDSYGWGRLSAPGAVARALQDTAAPISGLPLINGGAQFVNRQLVRLSTPAIDAQSAVADMRLANSGEAWDDWQAYRPSLYWYLSPGDGRKAVAIRYRDWAGNVSAPAYARVILDTLSPRAWISSPSRASQSKFTVSWWGIDDRSGMRSYDVQYKDGGGSWRYWVRGTVSKQGTFSGRSGHTYYFKAIGWDRAGNRGSSGISATYVP